MRESYFTSPIAAVLKALQEGERQSDACLNESLIQIEKRIEALLGDDRSPELEWRRQVAEPLLSLAALFQWIGNPVPSVEQLAAEMSI